MVSLRDEISEFSRELTLLLVEDEPATRRLIAALLKGVFNGVYQAEDGVQGLACYREQHPQVILTDNLMPGLSGLELIETIRRQDARIPIILMTAAMDTDLLVQAINLGISSFIPKPVESKNLRNALSMVVGLLENEHLQHRTVAQELALLHYRERYHSYQQGQAFRKELRIMENDFELRVFPDEALSSPQWTAQAIYAPHDIMCGDGYSVRKVANGGMLALVVDAMGKGLAASLSTTLCISTFNQRVDGLSGPFAFRNFLEGYLEALRRPLLEDEVLSLGLLYLPPGEGDLEAAGFGMPPLLLETETDFRRQRSSNQPFSAYLREFKTSRHPLAKVRRILMHTDGLNEGLTKEGQLYRNHLDEDFLAGGGPDRLWERFKAQVPVPGDDVTLLLLSRADGHSCQEVTREFPAKLKAVEAACLEIEEILATWDVLDPVELESFAMAAREALLNAFEHGSMETGGPLKGRLLSQDAFLDHLLEQELRCERSIRFSLALVPEGKRAFLRLCISDEGPGFTPPALSIETPDISRCYGRGIRLMKKYADAVYFNPKGNQVTLLKSCRSGPWN